MSKRVARCILAAAIVSTMVPVSTAVAHTLQACAGHSYVVDDAEVLPSLGIISLFGVMYVDERNEVQGNGTWIYLESNGVGGLQRGGSSLMRHRADPCQESVNPDFLVF